MEPKGSEQKGMSKHTLIMVLCCLIPQAIQKSRKMSNLALGLAIVTVAMSTIITGCSSPLTTNSNNVSHMNQGVAFKENTVTVFQLPTCDCCEKYTVYLREQGFQVETTYVEDMSSIRREYQIPQNMESCHTAVIEHYFVEGHVPIEAIKKLLEEKPDIDGIALPGMPSGSPGMLGQKTEAFRIYALADGTPFEFMTISE